MENMERIRGGECTPGDANFNGMPDGLISISSAWKVSRGNIADEDRLNNKIKI